MNLSGMLVGARRVVRGDGSISYITTGAPNSELPTFGRFDPTYFTTYEEVQGTYFEWFGGTTISTQDLRWGHPNRVYDTKGNELDYSYVEPVVIGVLDRITGDIGGGLIPYFGYPAWDGFTTHQGITKIYLYDTMFPSNSRTVYFEYTSAPSNSYYRLSRIIYPNGCVRQYQLAGNLIATPLTAEVDPEGFVTYFDYDPNYPMIVTKVTEPEGRISYYNYDVSDKLTSTAFLGRSPSYFTYQFSSGNDAMPMTTKQLDPLGNVTYYNYDATLKRVTSRVDPNKNLTYYEYLGGSAANLYAMTRQVSAFNNAQTYFGYVPNAYDMILKVGPRYVPGSTIEVTYYTYDPYRTRTSMTDALGNATLYGPDALGRKVREQDPRGYTTYWNYNQGITGFLDSLVDFQGGVTYFGYNSFRDVLREVSPRWTEFGGMAAFTTYYEYDLVDRRTKTVDSLGNVTYFDWTLRSDPLDIVDARGTDTSWTYNGLRLLTQETVTELSGNQLAQTQHGYDIYKNRIQTLDPRGNATYFFYDAIDRRIAQQDALLETSYFSYDSVSNLAAATDPRQNTTYYFYDLLSRRTATRDALANATYYFYDLADNRSGIVDARGNAAYFFYDAVDRPSVVRDALADLTYFFYDPVGNRSALTDARFNTTYFFFDGLSRRTSTRDAQGNFTYFAYDAAGNLTQVTDARSNLSKLFYDTLDRVSVTLDPLLDATYFGYDSVSNRVRLMDARFNSTYFSHDGLHRRTALVDALGDVTYFGYDPSSNLTALLDARFNSTYFIYDAISRRSAIKDAAGNVTYFGYDPASNMTAVMDARANTTYFTYDALNRWSTALDPLGDKTSFFYDAVSNRTTVQDPLVHATYFGYDAINRLCRVQDALGGTTYFEFDPASNLTKVVDADKHATLTQYDTLNRPSALRFPDTGSAYFFYDAVSNRTKAVDPRGNATYYAYDAVNRLTGHQDALGRTLYFQYDAASNVSAFMDAEGGSAAYTYDALNRRTNIAYTAAGADVLAGLRSNPYYVYDPVSNLTKIGDLWGLHLMGYDPDNRLIQHQYPSASVVYFQYDPVSNVSARVYPGTSGSAGAAYDAVNRQTRVQAPSGATAYFTYDAASNLTQKLLGDSVKLVATYDAAERIAQWRHADKNGGSLTYFDYTRDAKGLITKAVREANFTVYYSYDPNDRLASEIWAKTGSTPSEVYGYRYAYDLAGNRLKARINGANTYYFYDKANQLTVKGTNAKYASPTYYLYDKNGSLVKEVASSGGTTYFSYNPAGLVARILWQDASATYFFYDGNLQRYGMVAAGTATYFVWDGPNLLQELNADGTTKEEHTNARTPIAGIGQLVETNRPGQTPQKIYPVMDPRGTITKWVQSDGSTILAAREYDAFGTIIPNSLTGTWPGRWGYQGQTWMEIMSANGSQRLLASPTRIYDSVDGRFILRDIVAQPTKNRYVYAKNNALSFVDPNGMWEEGGHYYTSYLVGSVAGGKAQWITPAVAEELAYFSQLPDEIASLLATTGAALVLTRPAEAYEYDPSGSIQADRWAMDIFQLLHSLHGGDATQVRAFRNCLKKFIQDLVTNKGPLWQIGFTIHALGDAYAHTYEDITGLHAFDWPLGHGLQNFAGISPDSLGLHWSAYNEYVGALYDALAGAPPDMAAQAGLSEITAAAQRAGLPSIRRWARGRKIRDIDKQRESEAMHQFALNKGLSDDYNPILARGPYGKYISPNSDQVRQFLDNLKKACNPCK
jgi:RHS repeat-associated protein